MCAYIRLERVMFSDTDSINICVYKVRVIGDKKENRGKNNHSIKAVGC